MKEKRKKKVAQGQQHDVREKLPGILKYTYISIAMQVHTKTEAKFTMNLNATDTILLSWVWDRVGVHTFMVPYTGNYYQALHRRLAGRFKPPLAGRCNDFAPSRQKNCHRQKQPSRPGPRKKKYTAPSRPVEKKKKPPRPASEKNNNRPVPLRKKKQPPRPASEKTPPATSRLENKTKRPVPP